MIYADTSMIDLNLQDRTYSMYDLTDQKFKDNIIEIPVTLGCDGSKQTRRL